MPGLVPGIHVFTGEKKGVDGRDKPGHDGEWSSKNGRENFPAFLYPAKTLLTSRSPE